MKRITKWTIASLLLAALLIAPAALAQGHHGQGNGSKPGITEGPDPIPHAPGDMGCGAFDAIGTGFDDGRPDLFIDPTTGHTIVVWAYDAVGDHDIALTEWDANPCAAHGEFLTTGLADELDPRVFVHTDGTAYVVWWESGVPERVMMTYRRPGVDYWEVPSVVAVGARRPSVTVHEDRLVVAYERDSAGSQEIVLATAVDGGYRTEVRSTLKSTEGIDFTIESRDGSLVLDWHAFPGKRVYPMSRLQAIDLRPVDIRPGPASPRVPVP